MEALIEQYLGNPAVLALLLFLAPFVLEEAAIVTGAGLAASGEMPTWAALGAITAGMLVSDWLLYGIGWLAGRSRRMRSWVDEATLARGRAMLDRGALPAGLIARLIPWMLFPIFTASGFLGVGFRRFVLINALIAAVYTPVLFFGIFGLNLVLFDWLGNGAWAVLALLLAGVLLLSRWATRRYFGKDADAG